MMTEQLALNWPSCVVIVCIIFLMGFGIHNVHRGKESGYGPNTLKALGIVVYIPVLVIIVILLPGLANEAIAALLGTIAGYVLSQSGKE